MTISQTVLNRIKLLPGSPIRSQDEGPRFRSSVKRTGQPPMIDLIKAAERAAFSLKGCVFSRRVE